MQTNKPIRPLVDQNPDTAVWNVYLQTNGCPGWWDGTWLLAECYMYRRVQEALSMSPLLASFDPFAQQKEDSWRHSQPAVAALATYLTRVAVPVSEDATYHATICSHMLEFSLWGNKMDLSLKPDLNLQLQRDAANMAVVRCCR